MEVFEVVVELVQQGGVNLRSFILLFCTLIADRVAGFDQETGAFQVRPRTYAQVSTSDISESSQSFEKSIHRAIGRDCRRAHVLRIAGLIRFVSVSCQEISPCRAAEFRIVMRPVHFSSEVPSQQASNDYIGSEVLFAGNARHGDGGGDTISRNFRERSRVLMSHHTRHRPGNGRVFRRKGTASLKKSPVAIALEGTRALRHYFEGIGRQSTVESGLTSEEPCFAQVFVVRQMSQKEGSPGRTDKREGGVIGNLFASIQLTRAAGNLLRQPAVGGNGSARRGCYRQDPAQIPHLPSQSLRPDVLLIRADVPGTIRASPVLAI